MAVNSFVHVNECGLSLNAIDWLERHHQGKSQERQQMIRDMQILQGSFVVDAGCGPGLWTSLLAQAVGLNGQIMGVDISSEALVTAQKRCAHLPYHTQIQYKCANLDDLPVPSGTVDLIFSANVSQYLPDPVSTFTSLGSFLKPGGRLVVKDIDFGFMNFPSIDPVLQSHVFEARKSWERERVHHGYAFEDSWVGSKLAEYLLRAGFVDIQIKTYQIVRHFPLSDDFRFYLQGISEWFVSEGAPSLSYQDIDLWLQCFSNAGDCALNQDDFVSEETEFVVSGVWQPKSIPRSIASIK